jgi:lactate dehydrogenase-like 2-hydroxyacid dehydrogenase
MNIVEILTSKYPGCEWSLVGEDYEGLNWLSDTPKPTEKQLEDLWPIVQAEIQAAAQAKIDAKASAIAKLEALGLTVQEVEVAFGLTA